MYFAEDFVSNPGSHHDSKMVDLSKLLNSLPIHANRAENATFRNSHGAYTTALRRIVPPRGAVA